MYFYNNNYYYCSAKIPITLTSIIKNPSVILCYSMYLILLELQALKCYSMYLFPLDLQA